MLVRPFSKATPKTKITTDKKLPAVCSEPGGMGSEEEAEFRPGHLLKLKDAAGVTFVFLEKKNQENP